MSALKKANGSCDKIKETQVVYGVESVKKPYRVRHKGNSAVMGKKEIMDIMTKSKRELELRYGVRKLGLFGSYVRERQGKTSDVDILVAFVRDIDLFEFIDLREYLEERIGGKVDLVMESALKPTIGKHILAEVEYV